MMYLVSYDIVSNRRRRKIREALLDCGLPVQRSVIECDLNPARLAAVKERLRPLIDPRRDQVRFYFLCRTCFLRSEVLGADPLPGLEPVPR